MNTQSLIYSRFLICAILHNRHKIPKRNISSFTFEIYNYQTIRLFIIHFTELIQNFIIQNFCGRKLDINIHLSPQR